MADPIDELCHAAGYVVGNSAAMRSLLNDVIRIASSRLPVLIIGPTGSGKEFIANLLHRLGSPPNSPYLDVNCGAIPETLIESHLFGHEKGSFTGATSKQEGYFSLARNGVLFLDEIGELPLWQQSRLLRVLETGTYRPVGASVNLCFHGRIIAATHVDLPARIQEKLFREDLYYRLSVVTLRVPSLRERRDDIPDLIACFSERQLRMLRFSASAMSCLKAAPWHGNVRELRNVIERIALLAENDYIDADALSRYVALEASHGDGSSPLDELATRLLELDVPNKLAALEHKAIQRALKNANGNKTLAAKALGVHRKYIERKQQGLREKIGEIESLHDSATQKLAEHRYSAAVPDLRKALDILEDLAYLSEIATIKLELLLKLCACLRNIHGWNHDEVIALYADVEKLKDIRPNTDDSSVRFGIWASQLMALELKEALETAVTSWREGVMARDTMIMAQASISMANTHFWMGDYHQTVADLQQFLDCYEHNDHLLVKLGHDPFVYYLMLQCLTLFQVGKVTKAVGTLENLIEYARETKQPFSVATALQAGAWLRYIMGDYAICYRYAQELFTVAERERFLFFEGIADIFLGHQEACAGQYRAGRERVKRGFDQKLNGGTGRIFNSIFAIVLADIALRSREFSCGLSDMAPPLVMSEERSELCYMPEALVMRGLLHAGADELEKAVDDFWAALGKAREIGSKSGELRAACALAKQHVAGKSLMEGKRLLTPIVLRFANQTTYPHLERAKSLLADLGEVRIPPI